jgi:RNA polymerase sigma factor (sigma-70 family)
LDESVSVPVFDEGAFLESWEPETRRRAAWSASRYGGGKADADDLTQEVLLALLRAARKKGEALNERYVRRLTTRVLQTEYRKRRRTRSHELPLEQVRQVATEPLSDLDPLRQAAVVRHLRTLPARQRLIFAAIYGSGLNQGETARALRVSRPRVTLLHRKLLKSARAGLANLAA